MNKYCSVCGKKKGFFEKLWHGQEHCSWCQIHQPIAIEYGELVDSLAEGWVLTEADERRFDDVFAKHCGTDCLAIEKLRGQLNSSGLIRKAGAKLKLLRERSRLITGSSPEKLFHFVGQAQIKAGLYPLLNSASINIEPLDPILVIGAQGMGKRTLSHAIAGELTVRLYRVDASQLNRQPNWGSLLRELSHSDILMVEHADLLSRLKSKELCIAATEGTYRGETVEKFAVIGSATRMFSLHTELSDLFVHRFEFQPYSVDDLAELLRSEIVTEAAARVIATQSAGSPRQAFQLLGKVNSHRSMTKHHGNITAALCKTALADINVSKGINSLESNAMEFTPSAGSLDEIQALRDAYDRTPEEFENLLGQLFSDLGYKVKSTAATADGGIDLFLSKGGETEIVQCKRYQGNVSVQVVREFFGVMVDQRVKKSYIVTTGHFTLSARQFAEGKGIHLIDGPELAELIVSNRRSTSSE